MSKSTLDVQFNFDEKDDNSDRRMLIDDAITESKRLVDIVGPQGLPYPVNNESHTYRRVCWFCLLLLGLFYSGIMVARDANRYYEYPSVIKPVESVHAQFPKITICLNSMHSKKALENIYPGLEEVLPLYYGQADRRDPSFADRNWTKEDDLNMQTVMRDTSSRYWIQACMYQKRNCIDQWKMLLTMYGYCLQLNPDERLSHMKMGQEPSENGESDDTSDGGRTSSLALVFAFNKTDWTSIGWANYLEGLTLYYSAPDDAALDPAKSILLTDVTRGVPIVSLSQQGTRRLGQPYSDCRHSTYSMLHYRNYTRNQCLFECLMDRVHESCHCSALHFPVEWQSQNRTKEICTFSQHSDCVAPILENFDYSGCSCPPKCEQLETHHESVQIGQYYAKKDWREEAKDNPFVMTSIILYMNRITDMDIEVAEYTQNQFFFDIGGAVLLMLAIAFAILVGIVDWIRFTRFRLANFDSTSKSRTRATHNK